MAELKPIRPEEIRDALVAFPPKFSVVTGYLAAPEEHFEAAVKDATGIDLPPGPQSMLKAVQESVEAFEIPALPGGKEKLTTREKREIKTAPKKVRFEIK